MLEMSGTSYAISLCSPRLLIRPPVWRTQGTSAARGFFLGSKAPFGYRRVKVNDGVKERPTLEVDPATAPIVKEIFQSSLRGNGLKEICRELNDRGITSRGKRWYKGDSITC